MCDMTSLSLTPCNVQGRLIKWGTWCDVTTFHRMCKLPMGPHLKIMRYSVFGYLEQTLKIEIVSKPIGIIMPVFAPTMLSQAPSSLLIYLMEKKGLPWNLYWCWGPREEYCCLHLFPPRNQVSLYGFAPFFCVMDACTEIVGCQWRLPPLNAIGLAVSKLLKQNKHAVSEIKGK